LIIRSPAPYRVDDGYVIKLAVRVDTSTEPSDP